MLCRQLRLLSSIVLLLLSISSTLGCTQLDAAIGSIDSFTSHPDWGITNYPNNYYACWVITAPSDHVVQMYTNDAFRLQYYCPWDSLQILCGANGDEGLIGEYCGFDNIPWSQAVNSSGETAYVRFETNSHGDYAGFVFYYTAVDAEGTSGGNCHSGSGSNESKESNKKSGGLPPGALVAIVMVAIIPLIIGGIALGVYRGSKRGGIGLYGAFPGATGAAGVPQQQHVGASPGLGYQGGLLGARGMVAAAQLQLIAGAATGPTPPSYTEPRYHPTIQTEPVTSKPAPPVATATETTSSSQPPSAPPATSTSEPPPAFVYDTSKTKAKTLPPIETNNDPSGAPPAYSAFAKVDS